MNAHGTSKTRACGYVALRDAVHFIVNNNGQNDSTIGCMFDIGERVGTIVGRNSKAVERINSVTH